ncbi:MAG: glycosyltransferase [Chloroflexi bacterium]|nr:glycosyltransferase [Chloroflexota bacterium]MCI0576221.1 glycosyltransferase [Chloroflexota bacterium]MCI0645485.1 glycosyltransferase [Chloroflexota bacterium]MCI0730624.1 glycosyltransferase [Chloroflexota bacterium]
MKITVLAAGSRGDIQPYLALAVALHKAGHTVRFAANANFSTLVAGYGLEFFPLQVDSLAFVQQQQGQAWLESNNPLKLALNTVRAIRPTLKPLLQDAWAACQGSEAIVYHTFTLPAAYTIGQQLGLPCLPASMYPLPTRAHPCLPLNIERSPGRAFNLLSHLVLEQFSWQLYRPSAQALVNGRGQVAGQGAGRVGFTSPYWQLLRERRPILCCYSPTVLPTPSDLPDHVHVTGYWFLEPPGEWQPDAALVAFLQAGPPPVYVGFGSMGNPRKAQETDALILEALALSGQRGLLASGWSGLGTNSPVPDNVFVLESAPHGWLLPRMAAIVHHGGVGTTGAGLRAGVPNIVVPHFADQYFWGRRVAALGAGPPPIPRPALTAGRLAEAIREAVYNLTMRQRAAAIGRQVAAENGVALAVELFHSYVGV